MTDKTRIKIAVIVMALFLAGITTAGLAARSHAPTAPVPATTVQHPTATPTTHPGADTEKNDYTGHAEERASGQERDTDV